MSIIDNLHLLVMLNKIPQALLSEGEKQIQHLHVYLYAGPSWGILICNQLFLRMSALASLFLFMMFVYNLADGNIAHWQQKLLSIVPIVKIEVQSIATFSCLLATCEDLWWLAFVSFYFL